MYFPVVIALTMAVAVTHANDDWTRFRGPRGEGVSATAAPATWSPTENIKWKTPLPGPGASSPILVDDKVYVTCYSGYGLDRRNPGDISQLARHVVCVDRGSGDVLWQKEIPAAPGEDPYSGIGVPAHGYASHTPVSDGEHLFAFLGKSGVHAYKLDGTEVWQTSVGTGSDDRRWGSASSPVLYENLVIVPAICESVAIIALDKASGKEVWRYQDDGLKSCWGTPALLKRGEQTDLVLGIPDKILALDPASGAVRWTAPGVPGGSFYTSVAIQEDGTIFGSAGGRRGGASFGLKLEGSEPKVIWSSPEKTNFGSPVVANGAMFMFSSDVATVLDATTGKEIRKERLKTAGGGRGMPGDYASPVVAGDRLYYQKANGDMYVYNATPELELLGVNRVCEPGETFLGTPAIDKGQMFIRSSDHLYCIDDAR